MKLYANSPGNCLHYNVVMTAKYFRFPIEVIYVNLEMESQEIKEKRGQGKYPFLEDSDGTIIHESNAIAAYVARSAGQSDFLGSTAFEEAQVEEWLNYTTSTLSKNMFTFILHHWGYKEDEARASEAVTVLKEGANVLNSHL